MDSFRITAVKVTGSYQFTINHSKTKDMCISKWISSPEFRVGEHDWTVHYYPQGEDEDGGGRYVSVFVELQRASVDVSAMIESVLLDKKGNVSLTTWRKFSHTFSSVEENRGWSRFLERTNLEKSYVKEGFFVLNVSITLRDKSCSGARQNSNPIGFPRKNLQKFREENKCTDVTFDVNGNNFAAHRLILAAHSPVFEAELFGSMLESNQYQIKINEMIPSIFKAMLDFMYIGSLPNDGEHRDDDETMLLTDFFENLLAAADRYAVENLTSMCENKLVENISLDTVLSLLELAEKHNCSELKAACLEFIVEKNNSFILMVSEEYIKLVQKYPSLLAELKEMASI